MAFIGNTNTTQAFTPAVDYFSGNASTTAFTLSRPVASVAQVEAVVNNVVQNPSSAYTVSGNTITFSSAPSSGTNNIYVRYTSPITQVNALSQAPSVLGPMSVGINGATGIGGTTNPIVNMSGNANNYVQAYVNNQSTGTGASADLVVYPDNGTDASGWVDMGITSSTFNNATYGITGANEGYLFMSAPSGASKTGNLVIATDSTGTQNAIKFATAGFGSTTERMRIDSSGKVGIGTASPSQILSLYSAPASGSGVGTAISIVSDGSGGDQSFIGMNKGSGNGLTFGVQNRDIVFQTGNTTPFNGTERMRIDSSGKVFVGTTTNANNGAMIVQQAANGTGITVNGVNNTSGAVFMYFTEAGANCGYIQRVGTTGAVVYATSSDYRLKENIAPITGALAKVAQLKPVTYDWKSGGSSQGFIAHELQEVIPDAVTGIKDQLNEDGSINAQGIDQSRIVATLTAAIQELKAINDTQAETINALTARVAALENK